jgi:ATP-dependent RNA helicase DeaD
VEVPTKKQEAPTLSGTHGLVEPRLPAPVLEAEAHEERPVASRKQKNRTARGQTRLRLNLGEAMDITAADIVQAIQGETGLPANVAIAVDVRDRHSFVDVASEHAHSIIAKLNRTRLKNHKVRVKLA